MSDVTNVVLLSSDHVYDDGISPTMERINAWCRENCNGQTFSEDLEKYAGGHKCFESEIYIGAFNHIDPDALRYYLRSVDWVDPESVCILIKGEYDDSFSISRPFWLGENK